MIGCDVLEPEPEPWGRPRVRVATAEEGQRCVDNHHRWYMEAIDRRIEEAARANGLSENAIAVILGRS